MEQEYDPPEQFSFFISYYEAFEELDPDEQHEFYDALFLYVFKGVCPNFNNKYLRMAWKLIEPTVTGSIKRSKTNANNRRKKDSDNESESRNNDRKNESRSRNNDPSTRKGKDRIEEDRKGEKNHPSDDDSFSPLPSGDAAVAGATPPSAGLPHCPECDDLMAFDPRGGFWRCRNHECRATLKPAAVDKGTPHCPLCHSVAHEDEGKWICPICGEIKAPDFGGAK